MKWTEDRLIASICIIAKLCAEGVLPWDRKEKAIVDLLDAAGWTRAELRDLNRRRQAINN